MNSLKCLFVLISITQLIIAILLYQSNAQSFYQGGKNALPPDIEIRQINIVDEDSRLKLTKLDNRNIWYVNDEQQTFADNNKVEQLLNEIVNMQLQLPITAAHNDFARLRLDDNQFNKKVSVQSKTGQEYIFYVGDAVGFNRAYLRFSNQRQAFNQGIDLALLNADKRFWLHQAITS
ncbi:hypothetical protein C2869_03555 [Saccharobesus litoralis]|uniref:DUF4340 domain-containing protein n=1 Tax=Saccharobesus litoralis TaxID=2172099 RepID=A0A2S0VMX5_9ALTE|nr:DUF4340 domain-containing protein [Saccharobesus litoralis]AWB65567.1 hypothetical protein C2869_03555 [Saccharobesus litoralis]